MLILVINSCKKKKWENCSTLNSPVCQMGIIDYSLKVSVEQCRPSPKTDCVALTDSYWSHCWSLVNTLLSRA